MPDEVDENQVFPVDAQPSMSAKPSPRPHANRRCGHRIYRTVFICTELRDHKTPHLSSYFAVSGQLGEKDGKPHWFKTLSEIKEASR